MVLICLWVVRSLRQLLAVRDTAECKPSISSAAPFKSGLQLFHNRCVKRDKLASALDVSPVSAVYWGRVKQEWQLMSVEEHVFAGLLVTVCCPWYAVVVVVVAVVLVVVLVVL